MREKHRPGCPLSTEWSHVGLALSQSAKSTSAMCVHPYANQTSRHLSVAGGTCSMLGFSVSHALTRHKRIDSWRMSVGCHVLYRHEAVQDQRKEGSV